MFLYYFCQRDPSNEISCFFFRNSIVLGGHALVPKPRNPDSHNKTKNIIPEYYIKGMKDLRFKSYTDLFCFYRNTTTNDARQGYRGGV